MVHLDKRSVFIDSRKNDPVAFPVSKGEGDLAVSNFLFFRCIKGKFWRFVKYVCSPSGKIQIKTTSVLD